jgi:cytochrome P450
MATETLVPTTKPIPTVKELPILGSAIPFSKGHPQFYQQLVQTYGDVCRFHVLNMPFLMFNRHEHVQSILVEKADDFYKGKRIVKALHAFVGNGVFLSEGEFHRKQRKMMAPAFQPKHIQVYTTTMVEYTQQQVERWQDNEIVDITEELKTLTLRIVGKVLFGQERFTEANGLHHALDIMTEQAAYLLAAPVSMPMNIPTPRNRRAQEATRSVARNLQELLDERKQNPEQHMDFLSLLLLAKDEEGNPMANEQIMDEALNLFGGGNETIPVALTWTFFLLAQHPEIYQKLQQEVAQVLQGRVPTYADLVNLPYCLQVFKETLRLYPPAAMTVREALRDVQIGEYLVPKGATVLFPFYAMHRNPEYFPEPERFDPERFAAEREKSIPRNAYMPFGAGAHICVGNHFAMLEGHLLLATITQQVSLELLASQDIQPDGTQGLALRPSAKVIMKVHRS